MKENNLKNYSRYSSEELIKKGLFALGINDTDDELFKKLQLYSKEIILFNKAFNLVNLKDEKDLIISHILDSLSAWTFFHNEIKNFYSDLNNSDKKFLIADVGSGAGFPGIPLASLFSSGAYNFSNVSFNLVERMTRRCSFLQNQKAVLALKNIDIINKEVELFPEEKFDILTCRAFRTLDKKILKALLNCTKKSGKIFFYKATEAKIQEDIEIIKEAKLTYHVEHLPTCFYDHARNLLIIQNLRYSQPIDLN